MGKLNWSKAFWGHPLINETTDQKWLVWLLRWQKVQKISIDTTKKEINLFFISIFLTRHKLFVQEWADLNRRIHPRYMNISHVGQAKKYNSKTLSLLDPNRPSLVVSKTKANLKGDLNVGNWSGVRTPLDGFLVGYTIPIWATPTWEGDKLSFSKRPKNDSWHIMVTAWLMYSRTKSHLYFVIATCLSWDSINAATRYWRKDKTKQLRMHTGNTGKPNDFLVYGNYFNAT